MIRHTYCVNRDIPNDYQKVGNWICLFAWKVHSKKAVVSNFEYLKLFSVFLQNAFLMWHWPVLIKKK